MPDVIDMNETGVEDNFFDTPALEVPKTPPDAHRAVITSVTLRRLNNDKQTCVVSFGLTSRDVPTLETSYDIFVPKGWEEGIGLGKNFDPASLPEEDGNKQQTSFRLGIANSDKTASLQLLVTNPDSVCRASGRDPVALGIPRSVASIDEYVEKVLVPMAVGIECIFLRRERGGDDPAFSHQLQVRKIVSSDAAETTPKLFTKYVKAWENQ